MRLQECVVIYFQGKIHIMKNYVFYLLFYYVLVLKISGPQFCCCSNWGQLVLYCSQWRCRSGRLHHQACMPRQLWGPVDLHEPAQTYFTVRWGDFGRFWRFLLNIFSALCPINLIFSASLRDWSHEGACKISDKLDV